MGGIATAPDSDWYPIGDQLLDVGVSTSLTIPAMPTGLRGYVDTGAVLLAQLVRQWVRLTGSAVSASPTGGIFMDPGDFMVIRGVLQLQKVRVIRDTTGGSLAITYYAMRVPR